MLLGTGLRQRMHYQNTSKYCVVRDKCNTSIRSKPATSCGNGLTPSSSCILKSLLNVSIVSTMRIFRCRVDPHFFLLANPMTRMSLAVSLVHDLKYCDIKFVATPMLQ